MPKPYLGETITDAVITVPAYFSDAQRQATKEAGQIAGLNVLRIINEPTSAALAYHLEKEGEATILVFDLGGGTFDVSLLEVGDGVVEVKATSGDNHLGGDDWDQRIVDWLVQDFKNNYGTDLSKDKMALQRLRESAEKAKIELSGSAETTINLPYITHSEQGPLHLDTKLTRAEFQRMTSDLLDRTKGPFQQVIKDGNTKLSDIQHVVLVGGSTQPDDGRGGEVRRGGRAAPRRGGDPQPGRHAGLPDREVPRRELREGSRGHQGRGRSRVADLKKALEGTDLNAIKEATERRPRPTRRWAPPSTPSPRRPPPRARPARRPARSRTTTRSSRLRLSMRTGPAKKVAPPDEFSPEETNAGPVIRDLRRIDRRTGQVRNPGRTRRAPRPVVPASRPGREGTRCPSRGLLLAPAPRPRRSRRLMARR